VSGEPAPVRAYIDELLPDVLDGRIEPGRVFDRVLRLGEVPDGLPGDERTTSAQDHDHVLTRRLCIGAPGQISQTLRVINGDISMTTWTKDELTKIGEAEELEIAPLRRDGTLRKPVPIWVVRVGDDLFVRSWRGRTGGWFRDTQVRHAGHIRAGGIEKDIAFMAESDPDINNRIDAVYRTKYRRHGAQYVEPMVAPEARSATIRLTPR